MLDLEPRIEAPDRFYEALIATHLGLSAEQSATVNARLILLLANQVGRLDVLLEALEKAREGITPAGEDRTMDTVA